MAIAPRTNDRCGAHLTPFRLGTVGRVIWQIDMNGLALLALLSILNFSDATWPGDMYKFRFVVNSPSPWR